MDPTDLLHDTTTRGAVVLPSGGPAALLRFSVAGTAPRMPAQRQRRPRPRPPGPSRLKTPLHLGGSGGGIGGVGARESLSKTWTAGGLRSELRRAQETRRGVDEVGTERHSLRRTLWLVCFLGIIWWFQESIVDVEATEFLSWSPLLSPGLCG